jgi:hypothetical protein
MGQWKKPEVEFAKPAVADQKTKNMREEIREEIKE